eukprot:410752-Amphidinium_carterae.2
MGGKGKSKSSKAPTKGGKPEILAEIQAALPQAARIRAHPTLAASQWTVPIRLPTDMGPSPGICLAYKSEVPELLRRIGHTLQPVAMLTKEAAGALGMRAYSSDKLYVEVSIPEEPEPITIPRFLTQLGFGQPVRMLTEGPELRMPDTNAKVTITVDEIIYPELSGEIIAGWVSAVLEPQAWDIVVLRGHPGGQRAGARAAPRVRPRPRLCEAPRGRERSPALALAPNWHYPRTSICKSKGGATVARPRSE